MHCTQAHQKYSRKRSLRRFLFELWLLILVSFCGCFHASQVAETNEVASHSRMRPIAIDGFTAEKIGKESLEKVGYEEIINLAEKAGFVEYKLNVGIQLISYESTVATGFVPVFSRYAAAAAVTSQADSPLPGPADLAAVGVLVVGLVDAGLLDGYLFNTLGGWLFSKAKNDEAVGLAKGAMETAEAGSKTAGAENPVYRPQPGARGQAAEATAKEAKAVEREVKEAERALKSNQDFRRWFHREYKADQVTPKGSRTNPDLASEQVRDAYQEWLQSSMPKVK
jgi:hypothetical protein